MRFDLIPSLETLRDLYSMPRTMDRFQLYIDRMVATSDAGRPDVSLPITLVNPMGKAHCLEAVEALIALDAEAVMAQVLEEAAAALASVPGGTGVCLNLLDDTAGGWTNRYFTEFELRLGSAERKRANQGSGFVIVPAWTSELYAKALVRAETLAAIYRRAWRDIRGPAGTVAALVESEGLALRFPGADQREAELLAPRLDAELLECATAIIDAHGAATDFPTQFACFFGDAAAASVGLPQVGLSPRAGFAVALSRALSSAYTPEKAILLRQAATP
jgi:hypothetical protein